MLSTDLYQKVLEELASTLVYLTLYFQGEPYLHPDFFDLVSFASERNIYTATSTNAHYLSSQNAKKTIESGLDRLIVSVDGIDQATYESYRIGGSLEKVIEGTKQLVEWKKNLNSKTPHIILQFLVFRQNEHQIDEIKSLGNQLDVDEVELKTAQIYDFENGSDLIPSNNDYARYRLNGNGTWKIKNDLLDHCWKMWQGSVITWDGKVVPCCFDKDAKHVLGDTSIDSFKDIWESKSYNNFRAQVLRSRSSVDICKNCSEGTKVWT
jgi:radical SAM protein with 4Fe4S-binding SPASM domain